MTMLPTNHTNRNDSWIIAAAAGLPPPTEQTPPPAFPSVDWDDAVATSPVHPPALHVPIPIATSIAYHLCDQGSYSEALSFLYTQPYRLYTLEVSICIFLGKYDEAVQALNQALAIDPFDVEAWFWSEVLATKMVILYSHLKQECLQRVDGHQRTKLEALLNGFTIEESKRRGWKEREYQTLLKSCQSPTARLILKEFHKALVFDEEEGPVSPLCERALLGLNLVDESDRKMMFLYFTQKNSKRPEDVTPLLGLAFLAFLSSREEGRIYLKQFEKKKTDDLATQLSLKVLSDTTGDRIETCLSIVRHMIIDPCSIYCDDLVLNFILDHPMLLKLPTLRQIAQSIDAQLAKLPMKDKKWISKQSYQHVRLLRVLNDLRWIEEAEASLQKWHVLSCKAVLLEWLSDHFYAVKDFPKARELLTRRLAVSFPIEPLFFLRILADLNTPEDKEEYKWLACQAIHALPGEIRFVYLLAVLELKDNNPKGALACLLKSESTTSNQKDLLSLYHEIFGCYVVLKDKLRARSYLDKAIAHGLSDEKVTKWLSNLQAL